MRGHGLSKTRPNLFFGEGTQRRGLQTSLCNAKLPADEFRFVPPKGVDVIGDPTPAAEAYPVRN